MKRRAALPIAALVLVLALALGVLAVPGISRSYLEPASHVVHVGVEDFMVDGEWMSPARAVDWLQGHRRSLRKHRLEVGPAWLAQDPTRLSGALAQQHALWELFEENLDESCHTLEWTTDGGGFFDD